MIERFKELIRSDMGHIAISIVLGFGLATMFKKVCKGKHCYVVKGPNPQEVSKYYYKIEDKCYKYKPFVAPCEHAESPAAAT